MFQLLLKLFVVDFFFVADFGLGLYVFDVLFTIFHLVQNFNIIRYLLLPILNLKIALISSFSVSMRLISSLVIFIWRLCIIILGFILTLWIILLNYLARLFTILICESIVSINLIFIVDRSIFHVLVLVSDLTIVMRLFAFNKLCVECIDYCFPILVKHQVINILLAHCRIILIN